MDTANPDLLLVNGRITTLADQADVPAEASALAITADRVVAVGSDDDVRALAGDATRIVDLGQRRVVPGLIDPHTHYVRAGRTWDDEVHWTGIDSLRAALDTIGDAARQTEPGTWICVMGGWHPTQFAERRHPTREDLDAVAPDHPVLVQFLYEWGLLNSAGMHLLDLDGAAADAPIDPDTIERDTDGRVTGRVRTLPSLKWLFGRVPGPDPSREFDSTIAAGRELARLGVTGVIDGGGANMGPDAYATVVEVARADALPVRVRLTVHSEGAGLEEEQFSAYLAGQGPADVGDRLSVIGAGEILLWSMHDSFTRLPQIDDEQTGRLRTLLTRLAEARWTLHMHLIRPETTDLVLDLVEEIDRVHPVGELRWSIVHGHSVAAHHAPRIARLGMGVVAEALLRLEGDEVAGTGGFPEVFDGPDVHALTAHGVVIGAGSDAYRVSSYNPFDTIHWLVTGRSLSGRQVQRSDLCRDRLQALAMLTHDAAWFSFEEHERGRLQPGWLADVAVLSDDLLSVDTDDIPRITSVLTLVGGRPTHDDGVLDGGR